MTHEPETEELTLANLHKSLVTTYIAETSIRSQHGSCQLSYILAHLRDLAPVIAICTEARDTASDIGDDTYAMLFSTIAMSLQAQVRNAGEYIVGACPLNSAWPTSATDLQTITILARTYLDLVPPPADDDDEAEEDDEEDDDE